MQGIAAVAATLGLNPDLCEWRDVCVSGQISVWVEGLRGLG